jgi:hypothetical protein
MNDRINQILIQTNFFRWLVTDRPQNLITGPLIYGMVIGDAGGPSTSWSTAFRALVTAPAPPAQVMSPTWKAIMPSQASRLTMSASSRPGDGGPSKVMHSRPSSCSTITNVRIGRCFGPPASVDENTAAT